MSLKCPNFDKGLNGQNTLKVNHQEDVNGALVSIVIQTELGPLLGYIFEILFIFVLLEALFKVRILVGSYQKTARH